jgi:hypothetical protein
MRERLIDLLDWDCGWIEAQATEVADYLLERRVFHIPCKVGDIVYQTDGVIIYELTILDISFRKNKPYYETDAIDFDDDAIGKSIFLTRQEAEAKLRFLQND